MKNEIRSTNVSDTGFNAANYGSNSGFSMGTTVAPDTAGQLARQAARRRKRNKILTVSIVICLVAVVSAVFAIYSATDWFKASQPAPSDLNIDTPTRVSVIDREAFIEAQRLGDFSSLSGGADATLWVKPFLIGYKLIAEDDNIVKIADSKIYGWTPGITKVRVETADGQLVDTFTVQVLDANGRLYYDIEFFAESKDTNGEPLHTLKVISGRAISEMSLELPAFPSKTGYNPQYWTVAGSRFFESDKISADTKVYVSWDPKSVSFLSSLSGDLDNGAYKADYSVNISDYADKNSASGSFTYSATNLPAGLTLDIATGIISGRPQAAGTYLFSITATDKVQTAEDSQKTKATKEFKLEVAKRAANIVIDERNLTYNGALQVLPVQITNIAEGDTGLVSAVVNYIGSEENGVRYAASYTAKVVSLAGSRAANYVLPSTQIVRNFTVAPRVAEIAFVSPQNSNFRFTYDGTQKTISAKVTNLVAGDICEVELSNDGDLMTLINVTDQGATFRVESLSNPNYILPSAEITQKIYIEPATLTVSINAGQSKVYAQAEPLSFTCMVSGARTNADNDKWTMLAPSGIKRAEGENVGRYAFIFDKTAIPTTPDEDQLLRNYTVTFGNPGVEFAITQRTVSLVGAITRGYNAGVDIADAAYSFAPFNAADGTGLKDGDTLIISGNYDSKAVGTGKTVSGLYLPQNIASNNNYRLASSTHTGDIIVRNITTITGIIGINKVYDGKVTAAVDISSIGFDGVKADDKISIVYNAGFDSKNVGEGKAITISNISLTGADKDNYILPAGYTVTVYADITPIQITAITGIVGINRDYNALASASLDVSNARFGKFADSNFVNLLVDGDTIALTITDSYFQDANAGNGKIIIINAANVTISNTNYTLVSPTFNTVTANIMALPITITAIANGQDKTYDANSNVITNNFTISGVLPSDTVSFSGTYAFANADNGIAISFKLEGVHKDNYIIQSAPLSGNILPKSVTVTTTGSFDKVYDATINVPAGLDLNGVVVGDEASVAISGGYSSANAGAVKLGLTLIGGKAGNYNLINKNIDATITRKQITVSVATLNLSKPYDGTAYSAPINNNMISGLVAGEDRQYTFLGTIATADKYVESGKAITMSGLTIMDNGEDVTANYIHSGIIGTVSITKKDIAISGNFDKVYDGTDAVIVSNLNINDAVIGDSLILVGKYATANANEAASQSITFVISGVDANNYNLINSYSGIISRKTISLYHNGEKVYNGTPYTAAVTPAMFTGLLGGKSYTITATLTTQDKNVALSVNVPVAKALVLAGNAITIFDDSATDVTSNFNINIDNCKAVIKPANLTLTAQNISVDNKVYDGNTSVSFSIVGNPDGLLTGDKVTVSGSSAAFDSKDAGIHNVTVYGSGLTLSGNDSCNYIINYSGQGFTTTAEITKKPLTIVSSTGNFNKVYDGIFTVDTTNLSANGLVGTETVTFTGAYLSKDASDSSIAIEFSLVQDSISKNYIISGAYNGKINRREVSVVYTGSKVYDGTSNVLGATLDSSNIINGDELEVASAKYDNKIVGSDKEVTFVLGGSASSNYFVGSNYTADITQATLTVDFGALSQKVYDKEVYSVSVIASMLTGLANSDYLSAGVFASEDANAGLKALSASTLIKIADNSNHSSTTECYIINVINNAATIAPREITVLPNTVAAKVYDGTTNINITLDYSIVGMAKEDESLFRVVVHSGATLTSKNVGEQTLTVKFTFIGDHKDNYVYTNSADEVSVNINVVPRKITVVALGGIGLSEALSKVYDKTTKVETNKVDLQRAGTEGNVIAGDEVGITGIYSDASAGNNKSITFTLTGTHAANYEIIGEYNMGIITARPIAYVSGASVEEKIYNGDTKATIVIGAVEFSDKIASDNLTITVESAAFNNKNVGGSKTVALILALSGSDAANYTLTNTAITLNNGIIVAKEISVEIGSGVTKTYDGDANIKIAISLDSIVSGDNVTVSGKYYTDDKETKNVGTGLALKFVLGGTDKDNYILKDDSLTGSITARTITAITGVTAQSRDYNGFNNAEVNKTNAVFEGIVTGDTLTLVYDDATFADKNAGLQKTVTLNGVTLGGDAAGNYVFNGTVTAKADINKVTISSVNGITAGNKTYNGNNEAEVNVDEAVFAGMIAGDNLTLVYTNSLFADKNVGENKVVTLYGCSLGGTDAINYVLSNNTLTLKANITKKDLTLSQITIEKTYDRTYFVNTLPALNGVESTDNGKVSVYGYYYSDSERLVVSANANQNLYVRFFLSGDESGNYNLTGADFDNAKINPKNITSITDVVVNSKVYDGKIAANVNIDNAKLNGIVAGEDNLVLGFTRAYYEDKNVGTDKQVIIKVVLYNADGITLNTNYTYTGDLIVQGDITPKRLTISNSVNLNKVYDGTDSVNVALILMGIQINDDGEEDTVAVTGTYEDKHVGNNKIITYSWTGTDANNYTLAEVTGNIKKLELVINTGFVAESKVYDGNKYVVTVVNGMASDLPSADNIIAGTITSSSDVVGDYNLDFGTAIFIVDSKSNNVTSNYTINLMACSVSITTRPISIEAVVIGDTFNKVYDGTNNADLSKVKLQDFDLDDKSGLVAKDAANVYIVGQYVNGGQPVVNVGKGIAMTFEIAGSRASNYMLEDDSQTATGDITHKIIYITQNPNVAITKVYNGSNEYNGEFIKDKQYLLSDAVIGESIIYTVGSKQYDSVYVTTATTLTVTFNLTDAPVNKNYLLAANNVDPYTTINVGFNASITVQYANVFNIIFPSSGNSVNCEMDESINAPVASLVNDTNSFGMFYGKSIQATPSGLSWMADFNVYKLTKITTENPAPAVSPNENGIIKIVGFGINTWYYDTSETAPMSGGSSYLGENDSLYYIVPIYPPRYYNLNSSDTNPNSPANRALASVGLTYTNSFIKIGNPT